jgi:hypothetical protein
MESIAQHRMAALVVRVGSRICALRISDVEVVEAMGALDRELPVVLRAAKTISEDVGQALDSRRNAL